MGFVDSLMQTTVTFDISCHTFSYFLRGALYYSGTHGLRFLIGPLLLVWKGHSAPLNILDRLFQPPHCTRTVSVWLLMSFCDTYFKAVANGVVGVALTTPVFDKSQGESFKMLLLFCDFPIQPTWFKKVVYSSVT